MDKNWISKLEKGAVPKDEIRKHLLRFKEEDINILDALMTRIVDECPQLELLPVRGLEPFSFHIKIPIETNPSVMVAVYPQIRNGIKVKSRKSLLGYKQNSDPQLKWETQIHNCADIDIVLRHLIGKAEQL